jgi:hypothetical protein
MSSAFTKAAAAGYRGDCGDHLGFRTRVAHALGGYFSRTGRTEPRDVRVLTDDRIVANDMTFGCSMTADGELTFSRHA